MAFSPDYVRLVLNQNFEDAKGAFLTPLMDVHRAHLVMLAERGILTREDARALAAGLDRVDLEAVARAPFDAASEDLFFHVNRLLADACGAERTGRLHTARSRNDIDMTLYRMRLRELVLAVAEAALDLRETLVDIAAEHTTSVFPAHTHGQPAQPTTLAHYLLAVVEQLERDATRLDQAYQTTNRNPLGACAITGTGFPIDRDRTSVLLGFDGPSGNTYGSIAAVDYLLESAGAASTLVIGLGRFVQDMLLWSTVEMGYVRLPDDLVQVSSIMPQKRNPVALEHARAIASKAVGQLAAIAAAVHNTPFGDIVDTEDDLQPLVAAGFGDAVRAVALVRVALARAEFDVDLMARRAASGWVAITELADTLVREEGWPFEQAHAVTTALAREPRSADDRDVARRLRAAAAAAGLQIGLDDGAVAAALSPHRFVTVRATPGGPAPPVVSAAIAASRRQCDDDRQRVTARRQQLAQAGETLRSAIAAL